MPMFICETTTFFNGRLYRPGDKFQGAKASRLFREIGKAKDAPSKGSREALEKEAKDLGINVKPEWKDGYLKALITKARNSGASTLSEEQGKDVPQAQE